MLLVVHRVFFIRNGAIDIQPGQGDKIDIEVECNIVVLEDFKHIQGTVE